MKTIRILLLSISILAIHACNNAPKQLENTDFDIVVHSSYEPESFHPTNNISAFRTQLFTLTQRAPLRVDLESLELTPMLLSALPKTEDGINYEYQFLEDIRWDDGSRMTAYDMLFSIKTVLSAQTNNPSLRPLFRGTIADAWVDEQDSFKLHMRCVERHAANIQVLSECYVLQAALWDNAGVMDKYTVLEILVQADSLETDWGNSFNAFERGSEAIWQTGLGAYRFSEWRKGEFILLERKGNWWGEGKAGIHNLANPSRIFFKFITDDNATMLALRKGEIDVTNKIATNEFVSLLNEDAFVQHYNTMMHDMMGYTYLGMNMKPDGIKRKPIFTGQKTRRAMAHAIPVDEIISTVLADIGGDRQLSIISKLLKEEFNEALSPIEFDLAKAAALLAEDGWGDENKDGILDRREQGKRIDFRFELNILSGKQSTVDMALIIQSNLKKIGIDMSINALEFNTFYNAAYSHDFDAIMGAWNMSAGYTDQTQLWHSSTWNGGSNFCGFGTSYSDSLIEFSNTTLDNELRTKASKELQKEVYEVQPYVFLYSMKGKLAVHKKFKNVKVYIERPYIMINAFSYDESFQSDTIQVVN